MDFLSHLYFSRNMPIPSYVVPVPLAQYKRMTKCFWLIIWYRKSNLYLFRLHHLNKVAPCNFDPFLLFLVWSASSPASLNLKGKRQLLSHHFRDISTIWIILSNKISMDTEVQNTSKFKSQITKLLVLKRCASACTGSRLCRDWLTWNDLLFCTLQFCW